MFLLNWYREFLTIRGERTCQNCEYLKLQIEKLQLQNEQLLQKLMNPIVPEVKSVNEPKEAIKPKFIPWRVRRQTLEAEDARAAAVLNQRKAEIEQTEGKLADKDDPDVIALEHELGIIEKERENASQIS